jgi:hypothetical protein
VTIKTSVGLDDWIYCFVFLPFYLTASFQIRRLDRKGGIAWQCGCGCRVSKHLERIRSSHLFEGVPTLA